MDERITDEQFDRHLGSFDRWTKFQGLVSYELFQKYQIIDGQQFGNRCVHERWLNTWKDILILTKQVLNEATITK